MGAVGRRSRGPRSGSDRDLPLRPAIPSRAWSCRNPRKVIGPVFPNAITWTADSRAILYSGPANADFDADIYTVDVHSRHTKNLTHEPVIDGTLVQNSQPTVSPNGRYFVYSRGGGSTGADLYRSNINGTNPMQLTAAPLNDNAADHSPNGKRLVFHSNRNGDADIYTMKAAVEGPNNPAVNLTDGLRSTDGAKASQERAPASQPTAGGSPSGGSPTRRTARQRGSPTVRSTACTPTAVGSATSPKTTPPTPTHALVGARTLLPLSTGDIQPGWGPTPGRRPRH